MDARTRRGCLWAGAGGCLLLIVVGGALLAGGGWFIYQNFSLGTEHVAAEDAEAEFEALRARFGDQRPLVVVGEDGTARVEPRDSRAPGTIESVHLVAYDPDDRQIARMRMPFWLLRLSAKDGQLSFSHDGRTHVRSVQLSVRDVEDAGPGLIVDEVEADGRRVLIWAE